jgi:formylmethanofuran dehydrogenase subunit B
MPPTIQSPDITAPDLVVRDATCLACGCLCDDLNLTVREGRIVAAEHACEIGRQWFLADRSCEETVEATVDGRPASRSEAVVRATEILLSARSPVILGLSRTATESAAAAVAVADRIGAAIEVGAGPESRRALQALQRVGRVSATLGEVKNRADVVLFWGVDPLVTHPRHWERYSVAPAGRFVPEGRAGRHVIVVDSAPSATAAHADQFLAVRPDVQFPVLWVLRALVRGARLDPAQVAASTGVDPAVLSTLAGRLKQARYGAAFYGPGLASDHAGTAHVEALFLLVRDLNSHTRFVAVPLGAPGNAAGADAVLTWQSGLGGSVDFARGSPRSIPGETSAAAMLARGAVDAALIVADDVESALPEAARRHLGQIARIVIAPGATGRSDRAAVAMASATCGIDAGGTVLRVDGVALRLRPPFAPRMPTDREWLDAIHERLRAAQQETAAAPLARRS